MDIKYIDNQPIIHVVDNPTSFQEARWLQIMTTAHTWEILRLCWIDVYIGPLDIIVHDAGTNLSNAEFERNASIMAIAVKCVPVEAPQSVRLAERYHGPFRRVY